MCLLGRDANNTMDAYSIYFFIYIVNRTSHLTKITLGNRVQTLKQKITIVNLTVPEVQTVNPIGKKKRKHNDNSRSHLIF